MRINKRDTNMNSSYFVILGIMICILMGCNVDEDDVKAIEDMPDYFEIVDKPGEVNHLIYDIYKNYGVTIFINDTLGQEVEGVDAYGNPIMHTELFNMGYYVYGTYTDGEMRLSSDSVAMIVAVNMMKERVIPYLPKSGIYRPLSFLLADSVLVTETVSFTPVIREVSVYGKGLKGIVVGKLNKIREMDRHELNLLGGEILAIKCSAWILENCVDELDEYYKITGESKYAVASPFPPAGKPEEIGFLQWLETLISNRKYVKTPDREQDIRDYVALVYAYRNEEENVNNLYMNYEKVLLKFKHVKRFVENYEIASGVKE